MNRKFARINMSVLLALALVLASVTAVWAASVTPTVVPGASNTDKTCAAVFPGTIELKIEPVPDGNYGDSDGTLTVTIVKPSTLAGSLNSFDWTSNIPVLGVIVKDGVDGANAYDYSPSGSMGDTYLTTPFDGDKGISHISFCYVETPTLTEELTVSKTVDTSFTRTHNWDIAKKVETDNGETHNGYPKIWLYVDGSGDETATWTVDVTYEGYEDSDHNVSGEIKIENTGDLDAVITSVDDVLGGTLIDVNCGVTFPSTLAVGETLTCTYDEDGEFEGDNEVSVTTERDTYSADPVAIVWGDPTTEVNKTVTVEDSIEGPLGTVTAPNGDTFTYSKDYAWQDYGQAGCGDYIIENTATIVETDQSASATLKVNVQCLIFQGETAWAANGNTPGQLRYTSKGNWATYVKYENVAKCTTLFAGQTLNAGTVCFSAPASGQVTITVTLSGPWEFEDVAENLKVQGYSSAPKGNPEPGLFANKKTCDAALSTCSITVPVNKFYGVHVNVGQWVPDPNFGP